MAAFGPPRGAKLSPEKLATIADFINGEIAAQRIPGAIVLVQQHGKPVYLKWFGLRDPFRHQDRHQRRGDDAGRSRQDRARRSRQQIHPVLCRHEGWRRAQGR
jgi:hypothetical protein